MSEDEEKDVGPEDSAMETPEVPCKVTSSTPLFGVPPIAPTVSFRTFDATSVKDSVSSAVQRQSTSLIQNTEAVERKEGLLCLIAWQGNSTGNANA